MLNELDHELERREHRFVRYADDMVIFCNWLFYDTVMGAQSSAIVYSLVETAKANGLEPFRYLRYILTELSYLRKSPAHADLDLLLPWNTYVKQQCALVKATND